MSSFPNSPLDAQEGGRRSPRSNPARPGSIRRPWLGHAQGGQKAAAQSILALLPRHPEVPRARHRQVANVIHQAAQATHPGSSPLGQSSVPGKRWLHQRHGGAADRVHVHGRRWDPVATAWAGEVVSLSLHRDQTPRSLNGRAH